METRPLIEVTSHDGEGFMVVNKFQGWKVGILKYNERFSKFTEMERHLLTDEVFILIQGSAKLYTETQEVEMEFSKSYNVPKGVWHHIVVSKDAKVIVVENSDTSKDNTEKRYL